MSDDLLSDPDDDLLTTGHVAELLGCSRQHVVDLCRRGLLPHTTVGTHRRIRRGDLTPFLPAELTRDQARSLWLHQAVAGRLVTDPDGVLQAARENLTRLLEIHPSGVTRHWLTIWQDMLDAGPDVVLEILTSTTPHARDLRQNSPFACVLPETDRQAVLTAFRANWRRTHAACNRSPTTA
ncbi:helix-turn-helix domain-containing protein [Frankia sp. CiP1_Cm_nod2]|uniref:helix-turn-helix domain-containing protein n=1 Tax=Frankia sp. CiP1_Cm_nod2 TaxID=2897161 RepID=UPI0020248095